MMTARHQCLVIVGVLSFALAFSVNATLFAAKAGADGSALCVNHPTYPLCAVNAASPGSSSGKAAGPERREVPAKVACVRGEYVPGGVGCDGCRCADGMTTPCGARRTVREKLRRSPAHLLHQALSGGL